MKNIFNFFFTTDGQINLINFFWGLYYGPLFGKLGKNTNIEPYEKYNQFSKPMFGYTSTPSKTFLVDLKVKTRDSNMFGSTFQN